MSSSSPARVSQRFPAHGVCVCLWCAVVSGRGLCGFVWARDTPLFDIDTHSPQPRRVYNQSSADAQKSPRLEERLQPELCRLAEKPTAGGASTSRALQTRRKAHGWRSVYEQSSADSQKSPRLEERLRAELCRLAEKPTAGGASTNRALQKRRKAHGWRSSPLHARASAMLLRPNFTSTQCNTYASLLRKICTIHEQRPS